MFDFLLCLQESISGPLKALGDSLRANPDNRLVVNNQKGRTAAQVMREKALGGNLAIIGVI